MADMHNKGRNQFNNPSPSNPRTDWSERPQEGQTGVMDAAKEKIQSVASNVASGASDLMNKAKETTQEWASATAETAGHAKDKAQEALSTAAHKAEDVADEFTHMIRRYPMPALLISFGVGFLLAQAMQPSHRSYS